jgi:hypothetical protein
MTVSRDTSSTAAVSSTLRPAKNSNSTTRLGEARPDGDYEIDEAPGLPTG